MGGMLRVTGVDIKLTDAVDVEKNPNNWYGFRKFCELDEVVKVQDVELKGFDVVLLTWGVTRNLLLRLCSNAWNQGKP